MKAENTYNYRWDKKLILSNPNFGDRLNDHSYEADIASNIAFPEDYLLAEFSRLAYKNDFPPEDMPKGFELLTTATNEGSTNGYFGVAFWNPKLCQVVVAHRGTKLSSIGALISDLLLSFNKEKTGQSQSAATFIYLISEQVKSKISEGGPDFQLSITGHSLGAWLAQITTFTVKYFKRKDDTFVEDENYISNVHPHTVVFESPGCKEALVKLVSYFVPRYTHRKFGNYNTLDMTVYLSQINPINSINEHVGTIYLVRSQTHSIKDIIKLFDQVTGKIEKEMVLDFRSGMLASSKALFKKLVPCSSTRVSRKDVNENEFSLNVFTEKELDFVKDWSHIIKHNFLKILQFKRENSLPDFEIDEEYNLIKGENINYTVARIKRIQPKKTLILELLKSDTEIKVHYEIFKLKTQQYERDLFQFRNYYFEDKYCLKEFFKPENKILHIRVDKESSLQYELETSILNSIFTFYKNKEHTLVEDYFIQDQYGFIEWNQLRNVLYVLPDIFDNYKVKLLIIDCFEMDNEDNLIILQFLKKISVKVILLSTDAVSWKEEISDIVEVMGFGSNIEFRDLTPESQSDFFAQKNLQLYGREISLSDIVKLDFPFSSEIYRHLNKVISPEVLLELLLTPITEAIVMDCPFNNLLNGTVFFELYSEVDFNTIRKFKRDHSLFIIQGEENPDWVQTNQLASGEKESCSWKIQNNVDFTKECLENFDKVVYLLKARQNKLFLTTVFSKDFYIFRKIVQKKTISSYIFEDLSETFDQYYVCGNEMKFKEYVNKEKKDYFRFMSSEKKAKEKIKNSNNANSHLLRIEDDQIVWLYSRGNMESLHSYILPEETYIDETEMIQEDVMIISGEPGIGKSSIIGRQFLYLQKTNWVFVVSLKHGVFDKLHENIDFDQVAEFILKSSGVLETGCVQHLLSYCLKNGTNLPVCLLFDAYDEIPKKNAREKFINLVNFLKYSGQVKILITTRPYRCKELENGISAMASSFEILNNERKAINFLTNFWNCQLLLFESFTNTEELRRLAKSVVQGAENIFGETISHFIGIPMHLRMIAEVITPSSFSAQISHMDVLNLYQKYTQMRYDVYFRRCGFPENETAKQWLSDHISSKLYQLAIAKLFNVEKKGINSKDLEELNNVGIIQANIDNSFNFEFLHASVCDYFVTYLLKLWLESYHQLYYNNWNINEFIVLDLLLNPEYKEIRFFLDCYLKNPTISEDRLELCRSEFNQLWEHNRSCAFVDQETFFHICVKENLCFLIKHFLFQITNANSKIDLLSKRNSDLKTPLFLALTMIDPFKDIDMQSSLLILLKEINQWPLNDMKAVVLAAFCTYFITNEHLELIHRYSKDFPNVNDIVQEIKGQLEQMNQFLEICKFNNLTDVNNILKKYESDKIMRHYLLLITNERKETALHVTTSKDLVDSLLKLGADKDARDHHGMTPLARAIKGGYTELASVLIRKGADVNIADNIGNSPLNHAAKYDNLEIAKLLLSSKDPVDINRCNIFSVTPLMLAAKNGNEAFVKYLVDKGADVGISDWNGMTPLYHAVKGSNINLIRFFKQKGADVNAPDGYNVTPLLYSIMKNRWNIVICLLDNGAAVNICDNRNQFPIQSLIKKDRQMIIKRILKEDVKVAKDGTTIIREAARLDILTEEEKVYINKLQNLQSNK